MTRPRHRWSTLFILCFVGVLLARVGDLAAQSQPTSDAELRLEALLENIAARHPDLDTARQKRRAAEAEVLSRRGSFDTKLKSKGTTRPVAKSSSYSDMEVLLTQPTMMWGASFFGGWRFDLNPLPSYRNEYKRSIMDLSGWKSTPGAGTPGEFHAGVAVPLWQGGPIDAPRAELNQAQVGVQRAEVEISAKLLALQSKAVEAYYDWVAIGQMLMVTRELVNLADMRNQQYRRKIERGAIAPIDQLDTERYLLKRRGKVVEMEQKLAEKALKLSLFYRDDQNNTLVPSENALPGELSLAPLPTPQQVREQREAALERRPEMQDMRLEREQLQIDRELANNLLAPQIDISASTGTRVDKVNPEVMLGLYVQVPLQRRKARGKLDKAEAKIVGLDAQRTQLTASLEADINAAYVALEAAQARVELAARELELARRVEAAEKRRFELGSSTALLVNIREQDRLDAAVRLIDARRDHHVAAAMFCLATGRALSQCTLR